VDFSPQMGITIRTAVHWSSWSDLLPAMENPAPGRGSSRPDDGHRRRRCGRFHRMLCYYAALNGAPLTKVMPIAFTSPLFGVLMGIIFGAEPLTWKNRPGYPADHCRDRCADGLMGNDFIKPPLRPRWIRRTTTAHQGLADWH